MTAKTVYHTIDETAELLQVSESTVRLLISDRGLPTVKLSDRITRVPADKLVEWMEVQIAAEEADMREDHVKGDL